MLRINRAQAPVEPDRPQPRPLRNPHVRRQLDFGDAPVFNEGGNDTPIKNRDVRIHAGDARRKLNFDKPVIIHDGLAKLYAPDLCEAANEKKD